MKLSIGFQFNIELTRNGKTSRLSLPSWKRLRRQVKKRDESICQYCGIEALVGHVDHVIPLSRGGTDTVDNLVWSCRPCNLSKNNKMIDEWEYRPGSGPAKEQVLDLSLNDIDVRNELENIKAVGETRIMICPGDQFKSPRIIKLSTIWDIFEVSYRTGDWTRRAWKERGMTQAAWADCRQFLLSIDFWDFSRPEELKSALFEFYYFTQPTNQPEQNV